MSVNMLPQKRVTLQSIKWFGFHACHVFCFVMPAFWVFVILEWFLFCTELCRYSGFFVSPFLQSLIQNKEKLDSYDE